MSENGHVRFVCFSRSRGFVVRAIGFIQWWWGVRYKYEGVFSCVLRVSCLVTGGYGVLGPFRLCVPRIICVTS